MLFDLISKYGDTTNKDLYDTLFSYLLDWIIDNPELIVITNIDDFRHYFYHFLIISII